MTDLTLAGAQECDPLTGNPILASTIPPNIMLLPATLNEQFKQKMLIPPLSDQSHPASDSRTKWWKDSAFNVIAIASVASSHMPGHHIIPMSDLKDPLKKYPQFVELFRTGPLALHVEPAHAFPDPASFNAFSFLIFLPGGCHANRGPVFPQQGLSAQAMATFLNTILWWFMQAIRPDAAASFGQQQQDPTAIIQHTPFLRGLHLLLQLATRLGPTPYQNATWPDNDPHYQCNILCSFCNDINKLLHLFKCLIAPIQCDALPLRPLFARIYQHHQYNYLWLVRPTFHPGFAQASIRISPDNTIQSALSLWEHDVQTKYTMIYPSAFPPVPDAWYDTSAPTRQSSLRPATSTTVGIPTSETTHTSKSSIYTTKRHDDASPSSSSPSIPPLPPCAKPLLKWKVEAAKRPTSIPSLLKEMPTKPTLPIPNGKPRNFCFHYIIEGQCCPNKSNVPGRKGCQYLHVQATDQTCTKDSLANLNTALKSPPLSNYLTWSDHVKHFAS